jgi:hypothetical protein
VLQLLARRYPDADPSEKLLSGIRGVARELDPEHLLRAVFEREGDPLVGALLRGALRGDSDERILAAGRAHPSDGARLDEIVQVRRALARVSLFGDLFAGT